MGAARAGRIASAAALLALAALSHGCSHRRPLPAAPLAAAPAAAGFHTVQPGETLFSIARARGTTPDALARENALDDPSALAAGRVLYLPAAAKRHISNTTEEPTSPPAPAAGAGGRLLWPVRGVLISRYGKRGADQHEGVDLAAPEGTPVVAAGEGVVLFAGEQRGYGRLVLLGHGADLVTVYAHTQENLVRSGERVERGQAIARVGRTGNASGSHLHFEVRAGARPCDPLPYLR